MRSSNKAFPKRQPVKPKEISREEAKGKLARFCSYQERTARQVGQKMGSLGVPDDWKEEMLDFLKSEGYLNEKRYTESLIRGKINGRGWGPQKIALKLRMEGIFNESARESLHEADYSAAEQKLVTALGRKKKELQKKEDTQWKIKLIRFCLSRGFDQERAWQLISKLD